MRRRASGFDAASCATRTPVAWVAAFADSANASQFHGGCNHLPEQSVNFEQLELQPLALKLVVPFDKNQAPNQGPDPQFHGISLIRIGMIVLQNRAVRAARLRSRSGEVVPRTCWTTSWSDRPPILMSSSRGSRSCGARSSVSRRFGLRCQASMAANAVSNGVRMRSSSTSGVPGGRPSDTLTSSAAER